MRHFILLTLVLTPVMASAKLVSHEQRMDLVRRARLRVPLDPSTMDLLNGPQGAGADPGPACYDKGGLDPTVTDAGVVLGYLDPDFFLGGRMKLKRDKAISAIKERVPKCKLYFAASSEMFGLVKKLRQSAEKK